MGMNTEFIAPKGRNRSEKKLQVLWRFEVRRKRAARDGCNRPGRTQHESPAQHEERFIALRGAAMAQSSSPRPGFRLIEKTRRGHNRSCPCEDVERSLVRGRGRRALLGRAGRSLPLAKGGRRQLCLFCFGRRLQLLGALDGPRSGCVSFRIRLDTCQGKMIGVNLLRFAGRRTARKRRESEYSEPGAQ